MSAITFLFVMSLTFSTGDREWYVMDSDMTDADCQQALQSAPLPYTYHGTTIAYLCAVADGD